MFIKNSVRYSNGNPIHMLAKNTNMQQSNECLKMLQI